ncbi:Sec-independent protein translocase TatB [Leifsonia sp. A12D58]|uniref:Sec-independent protein translocase TatB n=1 Tax=Leifsonia sp. A12D58 TaxID=3397674 RepID=UPI0039E1E313
MFGLTFDKITIIAIIAAFLLGPERIPHYAALLGRFVRKAKEMANGAKDRLKDEMGPEFDEVDWKKLNPSQYDPRRIIRDALFEDEAPAPRVTRAPASVLTPSAAKPTIADRAAERAAEDIPQPLKGTLE